MTKKIEKVLISKEEIDSMVKRIGAQITEDFKGESVLLIGVLKGAFMFLADLVRHIDLPIELDFMAVSSYGNNVRSSGIVRILKDLETEIMGKNVIIVEDIIDSGLTLSHLKELLYTRKPKSISICAAFDKYERRVSDVQVDYIGMEIPDEFIVGYGLDYAERYRDLPEVCILVDSEGEEG